MVSLPNKIKDFKRNFNIIKNYGLLIHIFRKRLAGTIRCYIFQIP